METCKNCFSPIEDMRKETHCQTCNATLHRGCAINDGGTFCDVCYTVKEEDVIKADTSIIIPDVIRRSYIELYRACPYAFYLEVIKGIASTQSCFATLGSDLHELFYAGCKGGINLAQNMKDIYKDTWHSYDDKIFEPDLVLYKDMSIEKLKSKLWQQMCDAIDTFYSVLDTLPKNALALEETITFSVGDSLPNVSITMDRVDEIDNKLYVRDWKTGGVMVGQKLSSDLQAPLYIYAIREHFKKTVEEFTFYYLSENKIRTFKRIDDNRYECIVNKRSYFIDINDAIKEVQRVFTQIQKGNFNIPKNVKGMYFTCKTCSHQRNTTCKGADAESWRQYQGGK